MYNTDTSTRLIAHRRRETKRVMSSSIWVYVYT